MEATDETILCCSLFVLDFMEKPRNTGIKPVLTTSLYTKGERDIGLLNTVLYSAYGTNFIHSEDCPSCGTLKMVLHSRYSIY